MVLLVLSTALADPSALFGTRGEAWDPRGRLPDFSYAGYAAGEAPLPDPPVVADARDFGATGDGLTDDTAALQAAIDATSGGALWLPAGTYVVRDVLRLDHGDLVLRGDGPEATILDVQVSLADVLGPAPQWSWNGGFLWATAPGSPAPLATVTADATRGDWTLTVDDAAAIAPGDDVLLRMVDNGDGSLGRHLHNDQFPGGTCDYQVPLTLDWPVRVAAVDGAVITLAQPLRTDVRAAWSPALATHPALAQLGVESLTIRFPDVPYAGHLNEPGYNGIFLVGARDAWVRDVTFVNADNGLLVDRLSKRVTGQGLRFEGRKGHHGFNVAFSHDGLFSDLHFEADFVHHMSVDHRASGNVFKHVTSRDRAHLDHHRDAPFENLFTEIDAETDFFSGGNLCAGHPSAARGTFWGLAGPHGVPYWAGAQINVVGDVNAAARLTEDREWVEPVADLEPRDLHAAQLALRLGLVDPDPDTELDGDTDPIDGSGCACDGAVAPPGPFAALLLLLAVRRRRPQSQTNTSCSSIASPSSNSAQSAPRMSARAR